MTHGRGGSPILRPGPGGDPNQQALHTCVDCGYQLLIPGGLVAMASELHRRGCIGPKLANLQADVDALARALMAQIPEDQG